MRKILFHHLAKTAGTSLIGEFRKLFPGRVCEARYDMELTPELMVDPSFVFYHGHYSFEKILEFKAFHQDTFVFVFIRHPLNRVISQYYNWVDPKRTRNEYEAIMKRRSVSEELICAKIANFEEEIFHLSLSDFLDSRNPDVVDVIDNHQTRYLSSRAAYGVHPTIGCADAMSNLIAFYDFSGLMERYDEALNMLDVQLGLDGALTGGTIRVNTNDDRKSGGRYKLTRSELDRLLALNVYDLALYHFALGRDLAGTPKEAVASIQSLVKLPELVEP